MAERSIAARLSVVGGDQTKRELKDVGEAGQAALKRIESASRPAGAGLLAVDGASRALRAGIGQMAGAARGASPAIGSLIAGISNLVRVWADAGAAASEQAEKTDQSGDSALAASTQAVVLARNVAFLARTLTVVGIGAFLGYAAAIKAGTREAAEHQQELGRLEAVFRASGFAAGVTARQVDEFAESLSRSTANTDNEIRRAAAALAVFQNVTGDQFFRTLTVAADLKSVFGGDLPAAARQLGRAMEDPVQGLTLLRGAGVVLKPEQVDLIRNFAEMGDAARANAVLLGAVESKMRGAGAEEGLINATHRLGEEWRDTLAAFEQTERVQGVFDFMARLTARVRGMIVGGPILEELAAAEAKLAEMEARRAGARGILGVALQTQIAHQRKVVDGLREEAAAFVVATQAEENKAAAGRATAEADRAAEAAAKSLAETMDVVADARTAALRRGLAMQRADQAHIETLKAEEAQIGLTSREIAVQNAIRRLSATATEEQRATVERMAGALHDEAEAAKAAAKAEAELARAQAQVQARGKAILEGTLTAQERYNAGVREATELHEAGAFGILTYQLRLAQLKKELEEANDKTNDLKDVSREFGSVIGSTFEDAVLEANNFMDVLFALERQLGRVALHATFTRPVERAFSGLLERLVGGLAGGGGEIITGGSGEDVLVGHKGGVVGETAFPTVRVPAAALIDAPRLHRGLLGPNEFFAKLERGERVVPKDERGSLAPITINVTVSGPVVDPFKTGQQIGAAAVRSVDEARRRGLA